MTTSTQNPPSLVSLQRQWRRAVLLFALAILLTALALWPQWPTIMTAQWATLAAFVSFYALRLTRRNLPLNHRPGDDHVLPTFGKGTALTLLRGLMYGLLAGFFLTLRPQGLLAWLPALLYTLAGIADYVDGAIARREKHATVLGEILDIEFDALGLLVVVGIAVHFGQLPIWYAAIGVARYAFAFALNWRNKREKPVYDLPSSQTRRLLAGLQMGLMSVILWPIVTPELATLAGVVFAVPFLVVFLRDWLVASGAVDAQAPGYLALRDKTTQTLSGWLPVAVRLLTAVAVAALLTEVLFRFEDVLASFIAHGYRHSELVVALFALIELVALPFLVLGVAGRFFALLLIVPLGFSILAMGLTPTLTLALIGCFYLIIFGTGENSLWKPEERLIKRESSAIRPDDA